MLGHIQNQIHILAHTWKPLTKHDGSTTLLCNPFSVYWERLRARNRNPFSLIMWKAFPIAEVLLYTTYIHFLSSSVDLAHTVHSKTINALNIQILSGLRPQAIEQDDSEKIPHLLRVYQKSIDRHYYIIYKMKSDLYLVSRF